MAIEPNLGALEADDVFANRYIVQAKLGAGGMGAVYRVVDTFIGEVIALKLATVERDHSRRANALWALQRREVAMARRVTHPNVARVFAASPTSWLSRGLLSSLPTRQSGT